MSKSSEQAARELVDSFNREIASGGTGDQTRELAREIGGEQTREDERVARRRTSTSPRPVQSAPVSSSTPVAEVKPQEQVIEKSLSEKRAEQLSTQNRVIPGEIKAARGDTSSRIIAARREVEKFGFAVDNVIISPAVNLGRFIGKELRKDTEALPEETLQRQTRVSFIGEDFVPFSTKATVSALSTGFRSGVDNFGTQLRSNPTQTAADLIVSVAAVPAAISTSRRLSAATAPLRRDFIPVETTTTGRSIRVDSSGVTVRPQVTEQVIRNVPDGSGGTSTIILRGGVSSTAEDLATQLRRADTVTDAASGQIGIVSRTDNIRSQVTGQPINLQLRQADSLETSFFASPGRDDFAVLRSSRMFPRETFNPLSPDVQFGFGGNRPQAILLPNQRIAPIVDDLRPAVQRVQQVERRPGDNAFTLTDRQRSVLSADEARRFEQSQLQTSRDGFSAPGFLSAESEIITTAPNLVLQRGATTVIEGRRVPIFVGTTADTASSSTRVVSAADTLSSTPSNVPLSTNRPFFDLRNPIGTAGLSGRPSQDVSSPSVPVRSETPTPISGEVSQDVVSQSTPLSSPQSPSSPFSTTRATSPSSSSRSRRRSSGVVSNPVITSTPTSPPTTGRPPSPPSRPPSSPPVRSPPRRSPPTGVPTPPSSPPFRPGSANVNNRPRNMRQRFVALFKPSASESFRPSSISGGSLSDVVKRAVLRVGGTAKASFKIKDDKGRLVDPEEIIKITGDEQFRPGKSVQGTVVERRRFRISSPGEVQQISLKGQSVRRNKSFLERK